MRKRAFCICENKDTFYLCIKNKGADQLPSYLTTQLICAFVLAYARSRFSYDVAHLSNIHSMYSTDIVATVFLMV